MTKQERSKAKQRATSPRKRHVSIEVEKAIEKLALRGYEPIQIYRYLEEKPELRDKLPSLRTVQNIVRDMSLSDRSDVWTLAKSDVDTARAVAYVLPLVVEFSNGRITSFTQAEANWLAKVHTLAPDCPPHILYIVAKQYMRREHIAQPTVDLDLYLACAPWRGEAHARRYEVTKKLSSIPDVDIVNFSPEEFSDAWQIIREEIEQTVLKEVLQDDEFQQKVVAVWEAAQKHKHTSEDTDSG